jgi:hypothetical protein
MSKKIEFFNSGHEFIEIPKSSKNFIPDWYKQAKRFFPDNKVRIFPDGNANLAHKLCVPFLDSLTTGYIAYTWIDIVVENTDLGLTLRWREASQDFPPVTERPKNAAETMPVPHGHSPQQFTWLNAFQIKTPPGYSCLISHPFNRYDLPFTTLTGVVDTDGGMQSGQVPFFMKDGFSGIIPAGTPMFQILPFKRENWEAKSNPELMEMDRHHHFHSLKSIFGFYKNMIWEKKSYD